MPAFRAWSTGALNADLSTTAMARPSALPLIAVLVALTISATTEFCDPVHWYEQPSSLHASSAPYWVGVKNGLVVTWLTKTNFQFGVFGKFPIASELDWLSDLLQADSSPVAASEALARPVPARSRRRVTAPSSSVSAASATAGWTLRMCKPPCRRGRSGRGGQMQRQ